MASEDRPRCKTCRYWNAHSVDQRKGDCMAPNDHRYSRVTLADGTHALFDSFGREETLPGYVCGVWQRGQEDGPLYIGDLP